MKLPILLVGVRNGIGSVISAVYILVIRKNSDLYFN